MSLIRLCSFRILSQRLVILFSKAGQAVVVFHFPICYAKCFYVQNVRKSASALELDETQMQQKKLYSEEQG